MTTKNWTHFTDAAAWSDGSDWTPTGAPTSSDDAVFDSGTIGTSYIVTGNGDAQDLTVMGDDVTLTGTIDVENTSTGSLSTIQGGGTLTLASTAQLNTTSYVFVGSETGTTSGTLVDNGSSGSYGAFVGYNGAGTATVSGPGAVFSTAGVFYVGAGSANGTLTVSAGGEAYTLGTFYIGSYAAGQGAGTGLVTVTGTGSVLMAPTLLIGENSAGILDVQSGAAATGTATTIDSMGSLQIDDLSTFTGAITLDGGLIDAVPEQGGTTTGPGVVTLGNTVAVDSGGGFLQSDGPPLDLTGLVSGSGALTINSGEVELSDANNSYSGTITDFGTLDLANATAAGTATIDLFSGAAATLTVAAGAPTNTITGFPDGSVIDLQALSFVAGSTTATADGNTLVVTDGTTTDTLNVTGLTNGHHYTVMQGTGGGTEVVACYCAGTLILTDRGDTQVQALRIGDIIVTASGTQRPIRWIGRRSYVGRFLAANPNVQPIRFRVGGLGEGLPRSDLLVSPEHAMFLDGLLIPARCLVNGTTIVQERGLARVDYVHVELDSHDVLLAEGSPSESYLDDNSRRMFHNADEFDALYPNSARSDGFCAPRLEQGAELETIRRRLARVAQEMLVAA